MIARQNVIAVAVGVNQNAVAPNALRFAESDVDHFLDRLSERFPDARIWQLCGPKATEKQAREVLKNAVDAASESEAGTLVFYFSGHGALIQDPNGGSHAFISALLMHDASVQDGRLQGALPLSGSDGLLGCLASAKCNKLVVLDACHGGARIAVDTTSSELLAGSKGVCLADRRPQRGVPLLGGLPERCWVVTACGPEEHAYETDVSRGGVLTCALLEGRSRSDLAHLANQEMRWPDGFTDGFAGLDEVSLDEVVAVATNRIRDMRIPQTPAILCGGGDAKFRFPRILGSVKPMRHFWTGARMGPSRPPVPSRIVRRAEVQEICEFLTSDKTAGCVLEVLGAATVGKTVAVAAACKEVCHSRDERDRRPEEGRVPLAWVSLERNLPLSYLLAFISYHMITAPEGDARRQDLLASDLETEEGRHHAFGRVAELLNLSHGVVVFDNLQVLSGTHVVDGKEDDVQTPRERDDVVALVAFLSANIEAGRIVLISQDRRDVPMNIHEACGKGRIKEIFLSPLDASQAKAIVCRMGVNAESYTWANERYTPDFLAQAVYLIEKGILQSEVSADGIRTAVAQEIRSKGYHKEAFFLSLFHGTNTEEFLLRARKMSGNRDLFRLLAEAGIVVREDEYYRVHERVAAEIQELWGNEFQKEADVWRLSAAQEYGENAKKEFHLCQVFEARRHYLRLRRYADLANLLTDPRVYSPLRNLGYCHCARKWLLEVLQRLNPETEDQAVKRAWFLSALCLLELDRHEYQFSLLQRLEPTLVEQARGMGSVLRARFYRTVSEMYLVRRDHDVAQRWIDKAWAECMSSGNGLKNAQLSEKIEYWVESSRIALRRAELCACTGCPDKALDILDYIEETIQARVRKCYGAIARVGESRDMWLSDLCHQMAVTAGQRAAVLLMIGNPSAAREAAADCIVRSLFCRSYSAGDVLGRAIGHIHYANSILAVPGDAHRVGIGSPSWHADKAIGLLRRRVLREVCWYTRAHSAAALAASALGDFALAVQECDKGLGYLPQRLVPNPAREPGQNPWHASRERADELLGTTGRSGRHTFDLHELAEMSDKQCKEKFKLDTRESFLVFDEVVHYAARAGLSTQAQRVLTSIVGRRFETLEMFLMAVGPALSLDGREDLKDLIVSASTRRLTDPWREAEMLRCRALILIAKFAACHVQNQQEDEEILNAIAFAQYLCLGLARCMKHTSLVWQVLTDAARMAGNSFFARDPQSLPAVLMRDAARWAELAGANEQSAERFAELVRMLVPDDNAPFEDIALGLVYVRVAMRSAIPRVLDTSSLIWEYQRLSALLRSRRLSERQAGRHRPERLPEDDRRRQMRIPFAVEIQMMCNDRRLDGFSADVNGRGMAADVKLGDLSSNDLRSRAISVAFLPKTNLEFRVDNVRALSIGEMGPGPDGLIRIRLAFPQEEAPRVEEWVKKIEDPEWLPA